ncbi:MAG: hypothetical protein KAT35_03920, partial [Candidatus Aenigmarchaeota archaeon]|nr:hypothetical protein [Candidatus Aenigmarchaeota archaeon]
PITSSPGLYTVLVDTVDPVLELTGPNPEYVNEETFTIGWRVIPSDDINNIDYYVLKIDGSVVDSDIPGNQISMQYTGSAGNEYEISVTAYDLVGNPSDPAEKAITIDTEPPVASIDPLSEYMNTTSFELEWSGTDDLSGIEHYEVCINTNGADCTSPTTGWDNLSSTSETFTGSHGKTYYFRIRAEDAAENTGTWSSQENTTIDAKAPEFAGTSPDYPSTMTSSDYEDMIVNVTINDNVGIKDIYLVMGGSEVQPEDIDGDEGDPEWLVVWEIPYSTYMTETGFSITMTDVNSNAYTKNFTYSVSDCSPGDERKCDPRDPSDPSKVYKLGVCEHTATITCQADGTWGNCTGGILPSIEVCNVDLDDDCDGH